MKRCSKCGIDRHEGEFPKNKRGRYGLDRHCKSCHKAKYLAKRAGMTEDQLIAFREGNRKNFRRWYQKARTNPDAVEKIREQRRRLGKAWLDKVAKDKVAVQRLKELRKQWRDEDRAKPSTKARRKAEQAAYYLVKRKEIAARNRSWRIRNLERSKEILRRWLERHPGYGSESRAAYRARMRQNIVGDQQAVRDFYNWVRSAPEVICHYCGLSIPKGRNRTVDHQIPLAKGGPHCVENLVPACRSCNCSKNAKTAEEFRAA